MAGEVGVNHLPLGGKKEAQAVSRTGRGFFPLSALHPRESMSDATPTIPPLKEIGSVSKKQAAGSSFGFLSPRNFFSPRATPREPKELVVAIGRGIDADATEAAAAIELDGSTVSALSEDSFAARWSKAHPSLALSVGDVILSISGEAFDGSRPLGEYLSADDNTKRRVYRALVRRMVLPPRFPLSARVARAAAGGGARRPETEEALERALLEWEYYHPLHAYPKPSRTLSEDFQSLVEEEPAAASGHGHGHGATQTRRLGFDA